MEQNVQLINIVSREKLGLILVTGWAFRNTSLEQNLINEVQTCLPANKKLKIIFNLEMVDAISVKQIARWINRLNEMKGSERLHINWMADSNITPSFFVGSRLKKAATFPFEVLIR